MMLNTCTIIFKVYIFLILENFYCELRIKAPSKNICIGPQKTQGWQGWKREPPASPELPSRHPMGHCSTCCPSLVYIPWQLCRVIQLFGTVYVETKWNWSILGKWKESRKREIFSTKQIQKVWKEIWNRSEKKISTKKKCSTLWHINLLNKLREKRQRFREEGSKKKSFYIKPSPVVVPITKL